MTRFSPLIKASFPPGLLHTRIIPTALALLFVAQCSWFVSTQSLAIDEPVNTLVGREAWLHGTLKQLDENPPLLRLWLSLPILADKWQIEKTSYHNVIAIHPDPEQFAWRVRSMDVALGLILGCLIWTASRRFWGVGAANLAMSLWALSPNILAHFSLANLDGGATLMTFAVAYQVVRWRHRPSWAQTVLLGCLVGVHLAVKHSAVPTAGLALALALVGAWGKITRPRQWAWGKVAGATGVALLVLWGAYFFHVSKVQLESGQLAVTFPNSDVVISKHLPWNFSATVYIPAAEYFTGLINIAEISKRGFYTSLLGEVYRGGKWSYFPVVMALKWPTLILLLALGAVITGVRRKGLPTDLKLLLIFPTLYFLLAMTSNLNVSDRHILPVYPFLLVLAGGMWTMIPERRGWKIALLLIVVLQAVDTFRYAPDYYSYSNPLIRPSENYRFLGAGSLDGSLGLLALRRYEQDHPNEEIYVAYAGSVEPSAYGIQAPRIMDARHRKGTIIVSARLLAGRTTDDPDSWHWVLKYPRKAILNHSLYVFEVTDEQPNTPR